MTPKNRWQASLIHYLRTHPVELPWAGPARAGWKSRCAARARAAG